MTQNLADLHRSRLETLLAVEVEYQKKVLALSNQRIQAIKKLLTDVDALHQDPEGDELIVSDPTESSSPQEDTKEGKKKHKKATPPTKPVKLSSGKVPRIIDALQMVIKNKQIGAKEAHALLKAKSWLPNSKDPLGYIRFTLSDESEIFHRVEGARGVYELDPSNPHYNGKPKAPIKDEAEEESSDTPSASSSKAPSSLVRKVPGVSDTDAHKVVEAILGGEIPVD